MALEISDGILSVMIAMDGGLIWQVSPTFRYKGKRLNRDLLRRLELACSAGYAEMIGEETTAYGAKLLYRLTPSGQAYLDRFRLRS
jgi:hypothetical protein